MSDNIIHGFQQRRELEQAIAEMAETQSEFELVEAARRIKFAYPSSLILPALLKQLETPSSQLRGGLARLAALLPPEESVPALRQYLTDRRHPAQGRVAAAMILERFLGEQLSPALTAGLHDGDDAAFQSLMEAVDEGKRNRHVLLEYVTQMQTYPEEIALLVLQHLDRLAPADRIELLRLVAQDPRPAAARSARRRLELLAALTEADDRPVALAATRALHILSFTLPPAQAAEAERAVRKNRFRGAGHTPPSTDGWRALLAPAQVNGAVWVWLMGFPEGETGGGDGALAGLLLHGAQGIVHTAFADQVEAIFLPEPRPVGMLLPVSVNEWGSGLMLEAPFDVGRWLVRRALAAHWEGRAPRPPAGEYTLYNDLLWQFAPPVVDATLAAYASAGQEPAADPTADPTAGPPLAPEEAEGVIERLLHESCFDGWLLPVHSLVEALSEPLPRRLTGTPAALARRLLKQMDTAAPEMRDWLRDSLREALRMQAVWLAVAGRPALAEDAARIAASLPSWPPSRNPLLYALLLRGLVPPDEPSS